MRRAVSLTGPHTGVKQFFRRIHDIDAKWAQKWQENSPFAVRPGAPKYYQLPMFPYPSGRLHIGHLRVYTITDALARFRRMRGFNVIHPHGWDAFGLPAENAAIENNVNAKDWTYNHIDAMRAQIKRMLVSFDWEREIITCSPEYYKQTQKIFLELFRSGLAYRKKAMVNWDPVDKTVLANEQIDSNGCSWRSGAIAEQRELEQWFLRITAFSTELENDLEILKFWPDEVKKMQKQWIGTSYGAEIKFGEELACFTTKVETLYGVKFIAISETHPLAATNSESTRPNGLVEGIEATHPLTGEPLPVYLADYVMPGYGTEAVMGVPAHDERDRQFWEKVAPSSISAEVKPVYDEEKMTMVSGPKSVLGKPVDEAKTLILQSLQEANAGKQVKNTRLRDWLVSRQRFWGAPIPMVHCQQECGVVPVPDEELPVLLPNDTKNVPLSSNHEWLETSCPQCGGPAHRDPDTMDTFMDSSWYFFRYLDPHNSQEPFSTESVNGNMPVDCYVGGIEHAILHLLYSRFISKVLASTGKWDGSDLNGEPFRKLVTQGMVHGKTFKDKSSGRYLKPDEVAQLSGNFESVDISMEKMSKSKYNGVDPLDVIDQHGADATRAHMLFQAPVQDTLDWETEKIVGIERWLAKVKSLATSIGTSSASNSQRQQEEDSSNVEQWNEACKLQQSITESMESATNMNTIISDFMKLTKLVGSLQKTESHDASLVFEALIKMMAPVCPAYAEEFWEMYLNNKKQNWTSIHLEDWPQLKPREVSSTGECQYRVILNSKPVNPPVMASPTATEEELLQKLHLQGKKIKRVVYKPKIKLLSVVTN